MSRIGYLSNDGAWLTAYGEVLRKDLGTSPVVFNTSRRRPMRLSRVDVLVIPWAPDATWIASHRKHLLRFLHRGGVLIAFGEFESDWLPNMIWTKTIEDKVTITAESLSAKGTRARDMIFDGLTSATLSDWYDTSHGSFRALPADCDVLVRNAAGNPVVVFDCESFKGALLASSIDPDFHTYAKNADARRLFRQIISWALYYAGDDGGYRREFKLPRLSTVAGGVAPIVPGVLIEATIALAVAAIVVLVLK